MPAVSADSSPGSDVLKLFHPLVASWFRDRFQQPTAPQTLGWPEIAADRNALVVAPTGSGKTLAAFLWCVDRLIRRGLAGELEPQTEVLYISPLKALGNDVRRNLENPLQELRARADADGIPLPAIEVAVRSGDTPSHVRARMIKRPPHILITTPESLYLLLTARRSREMLTTVRTVIVDEIHAVAGSKRGSHLSLSLERLDAVTRAGPTGRVPVRIGLSATQRPIERIAHLLVGAGRELPSIVDVGHARDLDIAIEVPEEELGPIASGTMWEEVYDRVAELVRQHRTTLVFVNTRRLVERVTHNLEARLGAENVGAHHGSLARHIRFRAEQRLKEADLSCVVATASLELGIDVGTVDLVVQIGSPRNIATFLQRVGRSGHSLRATPKGRLFALTRDQLAESAALIRAVRRGLLDAICVPEAPLDILAQQMVAELANEEMTEEELFALVRGAWPYRNLTRERFDAVLQMLSEGTPLPRGRSSVHLHRDRVNSRVRGRRGARMAAITSGGAIPDRADYRVVAEPEGHPVGTVDEDFAIESMAGDIFLLGNTSWRIRSIRSGVVQVEDAHGAPPTIPFWFGEAPARTRELSEQVSELRREVESRLSRDEDHRQIAGWLAVSASVPEYGARQLVSYLYQAREALGALPTRHRIVAERFFDEAGGMQLVIHAPFGGRINKAWGLALRKRFCRSFNFELQAAATDDGIVISLGPHHSFPLESVFSFVSASAAQEVLVQAMLPSPMFTARWRWNITRGLAVLRFRGGKRVPPPIIRMQADDLMCAVFPAQQACAENLTGDVAIPDHPLVAQTVDDTLREAMDVDGLVALLASMEAGEIELLARDTPEASPLSHEILNANPYAFLDDAPLEERRSRAVSLRGGARSGIAGELGVLDAEAIVAAENEAAPVIRDADELHEALFNWILLPDQLQQEAWRADLEALLADGRVTRARWEDGAGRERQAWVATERMGLAQAAVPGILFDPDHRPPPGLASPPNAEAARMVLVEGHLAASGPVTAATLAAQLGLTLSQMEIALAGLEGAGTVLRGRFARAMPEGVTQWCHRRILARIHRLTLRRLRQEIEPVSAADLMRFLLRWQHVAPETQLHGPRGVRRVVEQLQGFEVAASAWESEVLAGRVARYDPGMLDQLTLGGEVVWGRLRGRNGGSGAVAPTRAAPITLALREDLPWLLHGRSEPDELAVSTAARDVLAFLRRNGASFLAEIQRGAGRLRAEVEDALWELVAAGVVSADGFTNVRALLGRGDRTHARQARFVRRTSGRRRSGLRRATEGPGGRWSVLQSPQIAEEGDEAGSLHPADLLELRDAFLEAHARQLLDRYGVVFRDLLQRERGIPPWRELLPVLRRLEARGEVRGGRFVLGFVGEQFALKEAVEGLRAGRRRAARAARRANDASHPHPEDAPELVRIAATDPLNMVGITSPGPRVPAVAGNAILYRNGVPVASRESGTLIIRAELHGMTLAADLTVRVTPGALLKPNLAPLSRTSHRPRATAPS